jgi:hypothetical protein
MPPEHYAIITPVTKLNILNFFLAEDTEQKWPVGN